MLSDKFGNPIYQTSDLLELVYKDYTDFNEVVVEPTSEVEQFENFSEVLLKKIDPTLYNIDIPDFDHICQSDWFIPEEYKTVDIEELLFQRCPEENYQRLSEELVAFKERNMLHLLKVLNFLVDTFRENKVIWGVGRGSSVASYALFLLDIHRVDSVKYNLDWQEFLR